MQSTFQPLALAAALALVSVPALAQDAQQHGTKDSAAQPAAAQVVTADKAVAVLKPTEGYETQGTITFTMSGDQVRVQGEITGLKPNSSHGFHVHEHGVCDMPKAAGAGGHFHLPGQTHGAPGVDKNIHAGDMGNIRSDAQGVAHVDLSFPQSQMTLGDAPQNIVNRGLIVHAGADDLKSQPSGNSGARAACAVIVPEKG